MKVVVVKITHGLNERSLDIRIMESRRKGKLMAMPGNNLDSGRNSLLFRGAIV